MVSIQKNSIDILDLTRSYWKDGGFEMVWVAYQILLTIQLQLFQRKVVFQI